MASVGSVTATTVGLVRDPRAGTEVTTPRANGPGDSPGGAFFTLVAAGPLFFASAWLLMIFAGIVGADVGIEPFGYVTSVVVTIALWLTPRILRHGGGWPPLTSAAVPVTLPSRVMVSSASAWPSTYRSKKASVTRAMRRSTGFVPSYGIRWPAPNRSR